MQQLHHDIQALVRKCVHIIRYAFYEDGSETKNPTMHASSMNSALTQAWVRAATTR
jgi:hypothetical protein